MANIISINSKRADKIKKSKPDKKTVSKRKKIDWQKVRAAVHKACRVIIFRTIEAAIVFFVVSVVSLTIGSTFIPLLAYDMSEGFGLTQSTNMYIAIASWVLPMLFYVILISMTTFYALKRFLIWIHHKFTTVINKSEKDGVTA